MVIGNIAPFENYGQGDAKSLGTSVNHTTEKMYGFNVIYGNLRNAIFKEIDQPYGAIIAAAKNGALVVEDAVEVIKRQFKGYSFSRGVVVATYEPHFVNEPSGSRRSTVFIDGRGRSPQIWLNQMRMNNQKQ